MHYLIDGHNLIGKISDISIDDPNDEVLLVLRLRSWAAGSRKRTVTVIFDRGLPGGRSRLLSRGRVNVIFAPEGQTADVFLIRRIQQASNPAEFTLVSSDRQVWNAARARRMKRMTAEEFAKRMSEAVEKTTTSKAPPSPDEAEEPVLSQEEIAEWLELFESAPRIRPEPKVKHLPPRPQRESTTTGIDREGSRVISENAPDPAILKTGDRELSGDEVDEWMKLFGQDSSD